MFIQHICQIWEYAINNTIHAHKVQPDNHHNIIFRCAIYNNNIIIGLLLIDLNTEIVKT